MSTFDDLVNVSICYGTVEVVSSFRAAPDGLHGGGFKIVRNRSGLITEQTEWTPNGLVIRFEGEPDERPWWKFWG
jgi:hypothetical protein